MKAVAGGGTVPISFAAIDLNDQFGPVEMTATPRAVREFTASVGDPADWCGGEYSAVGVPVAPPLFLGNALLFLPFTKFALDSSRGLHTHERLSFVAPLRVGETATIVGSYEERFVRRGQGCASMACRAEGEDGRVLIEHRSIEVIEADLGSVGGGGSASESRSRIVTGEVSDVPVALSARRGIPHRAPMPQLERTLTEDQISVFSWGNRGVRNAHTDRAVALESGLQGVIMQAMHQAALITEWAVSFFGAEFLHSGDMDLKFVAPAWADQPLTVTGAVLGEVQTRNGPGLEVEVWVQRPDGARTALGWVTCAFGGAP